MNAESTQLLPVPVHLMLQDRCRILGLPTWRFDARGGNLFRPCETGPGWAWLRAPVVERALASMVSEWSAGIPPRIAEAAEGFWVIPLVQLRRRKVHAYTLAGAFGPELLTSPFFENACRDAGTDSLAAAQALAPFAVFSRPTVDRLALCLSWNDADLQNVEQSRSTLAGFSRQLAEAYEEITLLQTLGHSMNQLANPRKFLAVACEELRKTLPFQWFAVRFDSDERLARIMGPRLHVFGEPPCPLPDLDAPTEHLFSTLRTAINPSPKVINAEETGLGPPGPPGIVRPCQVVMCPVAVGDKPVAAIFAGDKKGDDREVSSTDIKLVAAAASYLSILLENAFLYDARQRTFVGTLSALTSAIDAKDPYTCGHSERVAETAALLAAAAGLDEQQVERVRLAGIVHDVGKIGVPEAVLCKTGRLTDEEFSLIRLHPEIGFRILRDIPQFEDLLPGVLYHHERYDGRGYPRGLAGEAIPLMARIIGLADAFDAMSGNRTYRAAMPRERVFEELHENAGRQFDPAMVEAFTRVDLSGYDALVVKHAAGSDAGGAGARGRWIAA